MPFRTSVIIAVLSLVTIAVHADEIIYDYSGDVLPYDPSEGWILVDPCEGTCMELNENGRFVLLWPVPGDTVTFGYRIATTPEQPPPRCGWSGAFGRTTHTRG